MLPHEVKERIESQIPDSMCQVHEFSGGQDHYSVVIVSDEFEGKTPLARHRMVMALFREEVDSEEVHALSIKALTKSQWEEEKALGRVRVGVQ